MTVLRPQTPFGHTIFSDDLRQEISAKLTYVGVYAGGEIVLHGKLPTNMAKLVISTSYFERPGESDEPVKITVHMPGDADDTPSIAVDLPMAEIRAVQPPSDPEADDPLMGASANFVLAPAPLKSAGRIKVRAWRGDLEIRLGSILVREAKAGDPGTRT